MELLNEKRFNTKSAIKKPILRIFQNQTLQTTLFVEHRTDNKHKFLKDSNFAIFCTPIYIKPILLQNSTHHNLSTTGFHENMFQIFFFIYTVAPSIAQFNWNSLQ
jgi:hypothetical protein